MNLNAWFDLLNQQLDDHRRTRGHRRKASGEPVAGDLVMALLRPDLGRTPAPLRRFLEPIVATVAVVVLVALLSVGAASFTLFLLTAALMYGILTQVFGIELGVQVPPVSR